MIGIIERKHVTEVNPGEFATEASTIGIFPGRAWPSYLPTVLGNGQSFRLIESLDDRAVYEQQGIGAHASVRLDVFND